MWEHVCSLDLTESHDDEFISAASVSYLASRVGLRRVSHIKLGAIGPKTNERFHTAARRLLIQCGISLESIHLYATLATAFSQASLTKLGLF